jgi:hypothetical protein
MDLPFGDCRDGQAYDLDPWDRTPRDWIAGHGAHRVAITPPADYSSRSDGTAPDDGTMGPLELNQASVLLPPEAVGTLPPSTDAQVVVMAIPGRTLETDLEAVGLPFGYGFDFSEYDFVQRLELLVWTIAGVILAVGLLAFGLATIDRAVQHRKETTALRLVGIGAAALRRSQWVEATVPIGTGAALAVVLGALAGATYLRWGQVDPHTSLPWQATWLLVGIAVAGAVLVGAATVVAANPRIRPDEIRAE